MASRPPVVACHRCGRDTLNTRVLRFSLVRPAKRPDGKPTTRGCGAIDLCQRCWRTVRGLTGR